MRVTRCLSGLVAAIGLVIAASPANAQALRTEVITLTPPEGWVSSVWQGGTLELGEFTPPGQIGGAYIDLLGYSAVLRAASSLRTVDDLRAFEIRNAPTDCRISAMHERPAPEGWFALARICIGRDGAGPDVAELEFAITTVTDQAVYRIWRTHRAGFTELTAKAGLADVTPETLDATRFAALAEGWAPALTADLERRDICDLARPVDCAGFPRNLPPEGERWFEGGDYVIAAWAPGQNRITRERFLEFFEAPDDGTPNQVIARLGAREFDWNDDAAIDQLLTMFAYGQAADGALLGIVDPEGQLSPDERTGIRAAVIDSLRRLVRPGTPLSDIIVALPAE